MFLRQLQYLVAVAREEHFGRAAAACHVSQPGLSNAIATLEAELGTSLIVRDRAYRGLTIDGLELVRWAHHMLEQWDEMSARRSQRALRSSNATSGVAARPVRYDPTPTPAQPSHSVNAPEDAITALRPIRRSGPDQRRINAQTSLRREPHRAPLAVLARPRTIRVRSSPPPAGYDPVSASAVHKTERTLHNRAEPRHLPTLFTGAAHTTLTPTTGDPPCPQD
jgi:hypothetical protein